MRLLAGLTGPHRLDVLILTPSPTLVEAFVAAVFQQTGVSQASTTFANDTPRQLGLDFNSWIGSELSEWEASGQRIKDFVFETTEGQVHLVLFRWVPGLVAATSKLVTGLTGGEAQLGPSEAVLAREVAALLQSMSSHGPLVWSLADLRSCPVDEALELAELQSELG